MAMGRPRRMCGARRRGERVRLGYGCTWGSALRVCEQGRSSGVARAASASLRLRGRTPRCAPGVRRARAARPVARLAPGPGPGSVAERRAGVGRRTRTDRNALQRDPMSLNAKTLSIFKNIFQ